MPKLVISLPDAGEVIHELTAPLLTVGRIAENDIRIDDASISSRHAELSRSGTGYVLKDLGSTNGTFLNGEPVAEGAEVALSEGAHIRFGNVETIFETGARKPALDSKENASDKRGGTEAAPTSIGSGQSTTVFGRKKETLNPISVLGIGLTVVGLGAMGAVAYLVSQIQPPQF